ncbi:MAG: hypothetical protein ACE5Q6_00940 [Dehalococcoidia bacterium]
MSFKLGFPPILALVGAIAVFLIGCGSASLPEGAPESNPTQSSTALPLGAPPGVQIFVPGQGFVTELEVDPGERVNLGAAGSGQDLTYQWHLDGEGVIAKVDAFKGSLGQTNSYGAPALASDQVIEDLVSVTVVDKDSRSASDQITIKVGRQTTSNLPVPTPDPEVWLRIIEELTRNSASPPTVFITPTAKLPTPTPLPADCGFTITQPKVHSRVTPQFSVWGTATPACQGVGNFWVTVAADGRQWPQRQPLTLFPSSGTEDLGWFVGADLVPPLDQKRVLGVFVLLTTPALDEEFVTWLQSVKDSESLEGFSTDELLGKGAMIISGISVVRS